METEKEGEREREREREYNGWRYMLTDVHPVLSIELFRIV